MHKSGESDYQQSANHHVVRISNGRSDTSNASLKLRNGARRGFGSRGTPFALAIIPSSRVNRTTLLKELVSGAAEVRTAARTPLVVSVYRGAALDSRGNISERSIRNNY